MIKKGKVKWYNEVKGYGFISTTDGDDVFVHRSGLDSSFAGLDTDQEVEFETRQGEKGIIAFNVKTPSKA
ncbi:MAG: cold shock domain-containing protein [Bacteroidales bacterium]|nr:cold shock domain-containing protein [Bacteroidales bacterium]